MAMAKDRLIEVVQKLDEYDAARVLAYAEALQDWEEWDRQIEADSNAGRLGKLQDLADRALHEYDAGKTTPL